MKENCFSKAYCCWLICLVSFIQFSLAQDTITKNYFEPSVNSYFGSVIKAYPDVPPSKFTSINSIALTWQTNGKDLWQQRYRFPKFGIELFYSWFDNKENLGYNIGLVPIFEIKSKNPNKHFRLKFGMGASYFNKPFDPVTNPNNFYIGGHYTNMSIASIFWTKTLSSKLKLTYGFASIHCSNGHTTLPNAGMNILTGHVGLRFESLHEKIQMPITDDNKKYSYALKLGLGMHQFGSTTKAVGGPRYPSYHISFWTSIPRKQIHLWQLGFTLAYYTSFYDYIKSQEVYKSDERLKACTGVIFGGHEFVFGKFSFSTQAGIYVYNPFFIKQKKIEQSWSNFSNKLEAISTNRLGLLYYPLKKANKLNKVNNQLMMGIFIKANLAQADLFEYSVGYVF